MVSIPLSFDTKEFIRDTRHHKDIASNETYQSTPRASQGKPEDNKQDTQRIPRQARAHPEDNTETYQSITIAHHETYQKIPNDTLRAVLSDFICGLNMIVPKTN